MTKKDYQKIAELISLEVDGPGIDFIYKLMDILEDDNPRFDRKKFLTACGITV